MMTFGQCSLNLSAQWKEVNVATPCRRHSCCNSYLTNPFVFLTCKSVSFEVKFEVILFVHTKMLIPTQIEISDDIFHLDRDLSKFSSKFTIQFHIFVLCCEVYFAFMTDNDTTLFFQYQTRLRKSYHPTQAHYRWP